MNPAQIAALVIFIIMFILIITDKIERQWVTLVAGLLTIIIVFGIIMQSPSAIWETLNISTFGDVGFWYVGSGAETVSVGINWSTIIFVAGMMIMVAGMEESGFFRWLCLRIAKAVHYKVIPILITFMIMSFVLSMFIDSITVILFLAAVTIELAQLLKFPPVVMILAEIFCANLGGSATMCGDPPNIIIGTSLGYTFFDFLKNTGVIAIICFGVILIYFLLVCKKPLTAKQKEGGIDISKIPDPKDAITDRKHFFISWVIFLCAVVLLITHAQTGFTVALIGVVIAAVTLISYGKRIPKVLKTVDYKTLLFFIGLFIVVGGLEQTGVLELIADWIEAVWRLHSEMLASSKIPQLQQHLSATVAMYYDSLLHEMARQAPYNESIRLRYEFLQAVDADDIPEALRVNDIILSHLIPWSHRYAIESYSRYALYEQASEDREKMTWLVRSAISDARCGITDNGSSWLVAKECYEAGDLERAFQYSDYSLTNASFFNAPTRFIQTYALGHEISNSYEKRLHQSSVRLSVALIALALFLVALIAGILFILRQYRKLHALNRTMQAINEELRTTNRKLKGADKVKEQYICRYLEVYSDYIRRLTTMARKAGEKDPAAFMEREMENFYRSFDDTFLSLYGTFIDDFNALLKPEARLTPKPGERMTIEMRIFALILLGITSSSKIAELLCYSPNTISNYRVKMKNAAVGDRDTFEQQIQQIGK